ncbi:MAG: helix-turn-helix transcriptional regulator [Hydrogenophaga sp.]|nr:helix-turn-helix transcriptional regulator [Hydrogenophaga sp.]
MSRQVLLARPHPFIVNEMKPWLEQGGYSVQRPDHVDDLASHARACVGAVISLAVSSSMAASAADVLKIVRQANPSLPILFAALRPYLLEKPGAMHTVESLAELAGMSRSRFAHRFSASFRTGPMEMLRGLRLQSAARQLIETDAGMARVAENCGFLSRSYFSMQFAAAFGMTPSEFRRSARRKEN